MVWLLLTGVIALTLWTCVWSSHRRSAGTVFNYGETISSRWPDSPIFTVPGIQNPVFFDLQVILHADELAAQGKDPYRTPATPDRPFWFNYPPLWLRLHHLGANLAWVRPLGLALAALYLVAVLAATTPRDAVSAVCVVGLLVAPPSLTMIGMANNDTMIFALVVFAAVVWSRRVLGGWPALGLIGFAGLLKLYPACALAAFLDGRRRVAVAIVVATALLAGAFAWQWPALASVSRLTPRPHADAVGSQVLASRLLDAADRHPALARFYESAGGKRLWYFILPAGSALLLAGLVVAVMRKARRDAAGEPPPAVESAKARILFRLGAMVHLGYFAIGHNWFCREAMLILTIPWLLTHPARRWLVGLIFVAAWLGGIPTGPLYFFVQADTWVLTAGLAYWLMRDLAPDLEKTLASLHPRASPVLAR